MSNSQHAFKYKQIMVIRKDIIMSPAKLGVQIAHGAIESYIHSDPSIRDEWYMEGMRKIVLMISSLEELRNIVRSFSKAIYIVDFGLTEIEPNTITGITFPIMLSKDINKITKHLKLYA
jgi:peptidyl-tRNA hydrolase, PTH2 family